MLVCASAASGASSLAWLRTRVKPTLPAELIVVVTAPSNAYGTSTPSALRPSVRVNFTWYCVIVIALVGDGPTPVVTSFIWSSKAAVAGSLTTLVVGGVPVWTSDCTTVDPADDC